jgi:D-lactate dehydrogenase
MKVAVFSNHRFEQPFLEKSNEAHGHALYPFEARLNAQTVLLAAGFPAVSCFVTDELSQVVLEQLSKGGTRLIALRSAGFDHVDLDTAHRLKLTVTRVPDYSPYAVAEFAVGLILSLNRKIPRAHARVREQNFSLEGLLGFDVHGCTVGIVGTGNIGSVFARIMLGFGCRVLATDPVSNENCKQLGVRYVSLPELYEQSDIISLHCTLTDQTRGLIDDKALAAMKKGVMLINTGRGKLIDTAAAIRALKSDKIGYLGIDVYERENLIFFQDLEDVIIQDDIFTRLQTFPNVLITGHQAFFTREGLARIASITLDNITAFEHGQGSVNTV